MNYKEYINNAQIAINNENHKGAYNALHKAIEDNPKSLEALSLLGAVCVYMEKYDEALAHFSKAAELDPENGDNQFNLGNAHYFNGHISQAFNAYVKADKLGVSGDVQARLYFQLALLFSAKSDIKKALFYIKKCEEYDADGEVALSSDLITEKIKLYLAAEDIDNAESCARELIVAEPEVMQGYIICFSILMSQDRYDDAEKVLDEAAENANLKGEEDRTNFILQKASLYLTRAERSKDEAEEYYGETEKLINESLELIKGLAERDQLRLVLAEVYGKTSRYNDAIAILEELRNPTVNEEESYETVSVEGSDNSYMLKAIEMAPRLAVNRKAPFKSVFENYDLNEGEPDGEDVEPYAPDRDFLDRVDFLLLSYRLENDQYHEAAVIAASLKHSSNLYYSYYGKYAEAYCVGKTAKSREERAKKYTEALAYFKNQSLANPGDSLALVLRVRLLAECGKTDKATELAELLNESDREELGKYIDECKKALNPA